MENILDYVRWRGDLTFRQDPLNMLDALVFSCLAYVRLEGRPTENPYTAVTLSEAAEEFFDLPDWKNRSRCANDLELLRMAAASERFGGLRLVRYRSQFVPEEDTQFAAETFLLEDGRLVIAFRGTDNTLVGWKEDFNMSFQQTVPSQRIAQDYVRELFSEYMSPMVLCGHSKGGNLAVFSGARSSPMIQERIEAVYNFDGPGFMDYMMGDPGYLAMVPRIHTYIPQSSVIGMLMSREEPANIIHSNQVSILQHDPYTWEACGKALVSAPELTSDSKFIKATIENWLVETDAEERNRLVEAMFTLLSYGNVERAGDIFNVKNLINYAKLYGSNESIRRVLSGEWDNLLDAAKRSMKSEQLPPASQPKEPDEKQDNE